VSSDEANAISPYRLIRPYVGFSPTTPLSDAGWRTLPPVSVPSAQTTSPAATAAALPPLEPPGTRDVSHGLRTGPKAEFSFEDPIANSSQFVFPASTAPPPDSRAQAVASYGGTYPSRILEPQVVRTPFVVKTSFSAVGIPATGDSGAPVDRYTSSSSARSCASSDVRVRNARISPSTASIRARLDPRISTADTSPAASFEESSVPVRSHSSVTTRTP
jgi:hypothetical protein